MIKVKTEEIKVKEITYPLLMTTKGGTVVLFHEEGCGVVIVGEMEGDRTGHYTDEWDMVNFTPLVGSITLENG